jgi:hypothetical protein
MAQATKNLQSYKQLTKIIRGEKKGSSFGTTAAASRGVFYELAEV